MNRTIKTDSASPDAASNDFTEIIYVIDTHDRLVSLNSGWTRFARRNDGTPLKPRQVIGRSLWDFVEDPPTCELYHDILKRVRSGHSADLILRCDAPDRRRLIEMIVTLQPGANVQFMIRLLASKERSPRRLLMKTAPRSSKHVMTCSWCNRVHVGMEKWLEVEEAETELHLASKRAFPRLDHVICMQCFAKVTEILAHADPLDRREGLLT